MGGCNIFVASVSNRKIKTHKPAQLFMIDFETIYKQYATQVFRVCMGYVNNYDQAKDLMQETFISVWRHLPSFRNEAKLSTWIFRIATNNCLRAVSTTKKHPTAELPFEIADEQPVPREAKLNFLYSCIAELEEVERIIISLVLEDMPGADIAAVTGISEGNVRVKIYRIKEKLAIKFKRHEQFE